jgi:hypothetical protein
MDQCLCRKYTVVLDNKKDCFVPLEKATLLESTTTRTSGGLDFAAIDGKRQGHEVPQSLRVEPWMRVQSTRFGKPNKFL